eukprot:4865434-Prymnesium_polylepis.1
MRGAVGPSLVVAPLAVYQNWANECKAFTPELSFFKLHGSAQERAQLFSRMDVVYAEYDVFITTYDTLKNSETDFTETIPRWQARARAPFAPRARGTRARSFRVVRGRRGLPAPRTPPPASAHRISK